MLLTAIELMEILVAGLNGRRIAADDLVPSYFGMNGPLGFTFERRLGKSRALRL